MHISVIATVYNESEAIGRLLSSLANQTRLPDEIVICDGGSCDETVALIRAWADDSKITVKLLVEAGANISRGRNMAIAAAQGPLIAVTDAGVRLDPSWLEQLVAPWGGRSNGPQPLASAGFFLPDAQGVFQTAMAATVLPLQEEIDPRRFLPSSRSVAFTKEAWAAAGGYPEWLDYCEDLIFDFAINRLRPDVASAFAWRPNALVYFRPRSTLSSFWTQYYRYARGDGKANLFLKRHLIRYFTYLIAIPALVSYAISGIFASWWGWVGLAVGIIAYCRRPWQRLAVIGRCLTGSERIRAALWVPLIRAVGDVAKMVGYPVGCWWRFRNRQVIDAGEGRRQAAWK